MMSDHPAAAVIFDMDGVLVDSEPLHFTALNRMLAVDGHALTADQNEQFIGTTLEETMRGVVRLFGLSRSVAECAARYNQEILKVLAGPLEPAAGARLLLERLGERGLKLALASSSPRLWVTATLAALGFSGFFPVIICGDEVRRGKPDPEIFLRAAARLAVSPGSCIVIEDSPKGIAAASGAGMRAVAVRTPFTARLALSGAALTVDSLAQGDDILALCLADRHAAVWPVDRR